MPTINIAEPFEPLFNPEHPEYGKRFKVWHGGRGSGKTVSIARGLLLKGAQVKSKILCAREFQNSIADSVLSTLDGEIDKMGLRNFYEVQNNAVYGKNGTEFLFKGLKNNIQSVKSIPDVTDTWLEEAQTISQTSLDILIPTVLRTSTSQIIVSFNADDEDDAVYKRFVMNPNPSTDFVRQINFDENPWFPSALRDEMDRCRMTDVDAYNHIWLGQTRKNGLGSIYGKWMQEMRSDGRICAVPYNPAFPVCTAWDLGYGDSTVIIFFQVVGKEPRIIDCYAAHLEGLDHYVQVLRSKNYNYELHVLPHDAGHASMRTGTTLEAQLNGMGITNTHVLPVDSVETGIQLFRQLLPQLWMDEKCETLIKAMDKYQYEFDDDKKRFKNKPLHNWASDYADACRYMSTYLATKRDTGVVNPDSTVYRDFSYNSNGWMGG